MNKLKVNFENCYGIKGLKTELNFGDKNAVVIYAPNGTMKTSFTNSFKALSEKKMPEDRLNPHKKTMCEVRKSCGSELESHRIITVHSEDDASYKNLLPNSRNNILVASPVLRQEYEAKTRELAEVKNELLRNLAKEMGYTARGLEDRLEDLKRDLKKEFDDVAKEMQVKLDSEECIEAINLYEALPSYRKLFKEHDIEQLLELDQDVLDQYLNSYNEMLDKSAYLRKGTFNHYNLRTVGKSLHEQSFFKANHSITLCPKNSKVGEESKSFSGENAYDEVFRLIEEEEKQIFRSEKMQQELKRINDELNRNQGNRNLRDLIQKYPHILSEIKDIDLFKWRYWTGIFSKVKDELDEYITIQIKLEDDIREIVKKAEAKYTIWERIVDEFNERFDLPFEVYIDAKADAILDDKNSELEIKFRHQDRDEDGGNVEEKLLRETLSRGERRAVYFLDILYRLETDKEQGGNEERLVIFDDIADSFDYRNKHAIIQFLVELQATGIYKLIILTHNFDFYRSVASRLYIKGNTYMIEKNDADERITLEKGGYFNNVLSSWLQNINNNDVMMIACIPFARNLVELQKVCKPEDSDKDSTYTTLTSMLHQKPNTDNLTVGDLQVIYNTVFKYGKELPEPDRKVIDVIFAVADQIVEDNDDYGIKLENKVALSIALRLKAEEIMLQMLSLSDTSAYGRNPTPKLIEEFKIKFGTIHADTARRLDELNIITPEHIHLNAFMYEPLIDVGTYRLKELYIELSRFCDEQKALVDSAV